MDYSLGVDIGGTKIAAGIIGENGACSYRAKFPSVKTNSESMFDQLVLCINKVLQESKLSIHELKGIGIGVPGKVDINNGIAVYQNNLPWTNFPLVERIQEHFPVKNVVIDNDVYMATVAEWKIRGGDIQETFVYMTISTGISCCTVHNGDFIRGAGFAGEVGFLPVSEKGERLEETASGPGMVRVAKEHFTRSCENAVTPYAEGILQDFKAQKPDAVKIMTKSLDALAKGIYSIACLLDPDKLVLGGGILNHNPELSDDIKKSLETYLVPDQLDLLNRMEVSRLQDDSGLVGAGLRVHSSSEIGLTGKSLNL